MSRVGCHALLQGSFLTQASNPHLLHVLLWQAGSLSLSHLRSCSLRTDENTDVVLSVSEQ